MKSIDKTDIYLSVIIFLLFLLVLVTARSFSLEGYRNFYIHSNCTFTDKPCPCAIPEINVTASYKTLENYIGTSYNTTFLPSNLTWDYLYTFNGVRKYQSKKSNSDFQECIKNINYSGYTCKMVYGKIV